MKRFGFAIFLLSIFCLTGCGTKTLNCSMVNDANAELKINQDVIVDFKNDQMVKFDMKTSVDLSDNYASYADELEKNLKKENNADIVIFNNELSASQVKNIEEEINCNVIDRTALILDTQTSHTENIPYALINQLELNVESHSRTLLCTQTTHPKSGQIVQESFQERFDQQDF